MEKNYYLKTVLVAEYETTDKRYNREELVLEIEKIHDNCVNYNYRPCCLSFEHDWRGYCNKYSDKLYSYNQWEVNNYFNKKYENEWFRLVTIRIEKRIETSMS